ncbi:ROK family transcriptional regulator [Kosmotoga arenicorallina]|nr:ROK family transcriptional regulator [Kosmotoga arenicorallina]
MKRRGSKYLIKEINEKLILRTIYNNEKIDRASIAKQTGLSPAAVTKITAELINQGMILEAGSAKSSGGRKPILLSLNPDYGQFLGVKIGVGYIELAITDFTGKMFENQRCDTESSDPVSIVEVVKKCWNKCNSKSDGNLLGIGIAVSGVVDSKEGIVKDSFLLGWRDVRIAELLKKAFKCEVLVMNDVDSFAMSHLWLGKAGQYSNAVVITLGIGIGGALIIDGKIHTAKGGVGEIGHMTVVKDGTTCSCGSKGCLEAEASFGSLVKKVASTTKNIQLRELYKSVKQSESSEIEYLRKAKNIDPEAFESVFDEYAQLIGIALKNIINMLAPDYLLIGGEALEFKDHFLNESILFAVKNAFGRLGDNVIFEIDELGEESWALGSIYNLMDEKLFRVSQK